MWNVSVGFGTCKCQPRSRHLHLGLIANTSARRQRQVVCKGILRHYRASLLVKEPEFSEWLEVDMPAPNWVLAQLEKNDLAGTATIRRNILFMYICLTPVLCCFVFTQFLFFKPDFLSLPTFTFNPTIATSDIQELYNTIASSSYEATKVIGTPSESKFDAPEGESKFDMFDPDIVFRYKLLQLFSLPFWGKMMVMIVIAMHIAVLGGLMYHNATGMPLNKAVLKAYNAVVSTPGTNLANEKTPVAIMITQSVFVAGMLSFAVVLGIITGEISGAVNQMRTGNFDITEVDHTVVLGWGRQVIPMLRQMSVATVERGLDCFPQPIIVLADKPKAEMDRELEELGNCGLQVLTRSGKPSRIADLEKVAAPHARTVVMLDVEHRGMRISERAAASQKAATLTALQAASASARKMPRLVVQAAELEVHEEFNFPHVAMENIIRSRPPGHGPVVISALDDLSALLAQCTVQPGTAAVFSELLIQTATGAELHVAAYPNFAGRTFKELRRSLASAVACGVVRGGAGGTLLMNPSDDLELAREDAVVVVAHRKQQLWHILPPPPEDAKDLAAEGHTRPWGRGSVRPRIVVLCFGHSSPSSPSSQEVVQHIAQLIDTQATITIISESTPRRMKTPRGCRLDMVSGNPGSLRCLTEADVAHADCVVITGLGKMGPDEADSQVLSTILQLQAMQADSLPFEGPETATPQHIVACLNNVRTHEVLDHLVRSFAATASVSGLPLVTVDALGPDALIAGIITKAAAEPQLEAVYRDLMHTSGHSEIYLRPHQVFAVPEDPMLTWGQVYDFVRDRGETCIGVLRSDGSVQLAPPPRLLCTLGDMDRLVVIAQYEPHAMNFTV